MLKFWCLLLGCVLLVSCGQHYEEGAHPPPKPPPQAQMPPGHPPATKPNTDAEESDANRVASGTIRLADGIQDPIARSAVLFIIARPAPMGGPPLAVKRLDVPQFPFSYTLTRNDAMMGQGLDWGEIDALWISAKIDADGSLGGAKEGDLEGSHAQNPIVPGAVDVDIVIDQAH